MKHARYCLLAIMMVVMLISSVSATHSQPPGETCEYFAETGHHICDEFLDFFKTQGEIEIFGYPLTEAFYDSELKLHVQYFQRARMELHPQSSGSPRVLLGPLVDEMGYHFPKAPLEQTSTLNGNVQRYFPETGRTVSHAFLDYFRDRGGEEIFGYPVSELVIADGYVVQYFQRARMEWHPEAFPSPQILLTNVGELYIERFGVPGNYDKPRDPSGRIASAAPPEDSRTQVTQLNVDASVRHVISGQEGSQTVFVYITDQRNHPIPGISVEMNVRHRSGARHYDFEPTDENGFTSHHFEIFQATPGRKVVIDVRASYNDFIGTTQTFFLPWW
jgi:hypothetical protein